MKGFFSAISLSFAALCALGADAFRAELSADPAQFPAGSATMVSLTMDRDELKGGLSLPKLPGVVWHTDRVSVSQSHRYVNGKGEHSVTYSLPLSADAPGELTIPPLELTLKDGRKVRTNALTLKVLAPGERGSGEAPGPALPEGTLTVPAKSRRKSYYVGEEIPLELVLSIPNRTRIVNIAYPVLTSDGPAVFPDYAKRDKSRHPHFAPPREGVRNTPRGREKVVAFDTFLRFMAPGKFEVSATERIEAAVPAGRGMRRGADDDFFGGDFFDSFFDRSVTRPFEVRYPALGFEVRPLPPPPAGAHYLGLVGSWKIAVSLSSHGVRVGEPVELKVALSGAGSGEGLTAPKLELPDFRVYPPEVKDDPAGGKNVCYALIPLEAGEHKLSPKFAIFDPASGTYRESGETLELVVSGTGAAKPVPAPPVASSDVPRAGAPPAREEKSPREEFFYQKPSAGKAVEVPLYRNVWPGAAVFASFALLALAIEVAARRRERLARLPDPASRAERRSEVRRLRKRLDSGDDVADVLHDGGLELLARAFDLPSGSTAREVAEKVSDPELKRFLLELEHSSFAPGASGIPKAELSASARRRLSAHLRRALALAILPWCFTLRGAEAYNAAFDRGDYAEAAKMYAKSAETSDGNFRPDACCNAGCAFHKAGDAPRARLFLMRAHLLAPRDHETTENLNLVNRALLQNEVGRSDTPLELLRSCRDMLRPDEYLILALALFGLALLGLALRRNLGLWPGVAAAVLALLFVTAAATQFSGPYHRGQAVVVDKELELKSLPVSSSGVETRIPGGGDATVLETRGEWVRLLVNGRDGWARRSQVEELFPDGSGR